MTADGLSVDQAYPPSIAALLSSFADDYGFLISRLTKKFGSPDAAQDILHEVYLRLREGVRVGHIHSPTAFLYRMAVNLGINRAKRDGKMMLTEPRKFDALDDPAPDPERSAGASTKVEKMMAALNMLPQQRRAIFLARWQEERSLASIAQTFDLHQRTVQKELIRAEQYLRGHFGCNDRPRRRKDNLNQLDKPH